MGGEEVCGDVIFADVVEPVFFPAAGGGGASDAAVRADGADGFGGVFVEVEVVGLGAGEEAVVEVGLVPDFEVPVVDFVGAVAGLEVGNEGFDEGVPLGHVFGRGDVALPPEDGLRAAGEGGGHEGEFDEGTDVAGEESVVEGVDVLEVVDGVAVVVFGVDAHVVVEDAVEADVVEADLALDGGELGLPVGAEAFVGAACADGVEGRLGVWADDVGCVDGEVLRGLREGGCGEAREAEGDGAEHEDEGSTGHARAEGTVCAAAARQAGRSVGPAFVLDVTAGPGRDGSGVMALVLGFQFAGP